jgi:hypothetical protein
MSAPSWRETATAEWVSARDSPCLRGALTYLLVLFVGIVVIVIFMYD